MTYTDEQRHKRHLRYLKNKEAINKQNRAWREANPEKAKEIHRKYRAANQDKIREQARRYRAANRERMLEYSRQYYEANKESRAEYNRAYHEERPTLRAEWAMRRRYGIGLDEFDALLAEQGGRCAICRTDSPTNRGWNVDHCHDTDRVRGILCFNCNVAIGHLKDDPDVVDAAARYLREK